MEVAVTNWTPATDAETAMRDALRAGDQELYFRILARTELLLPLSSDAIAGRAPMGWGTWSSGGRTHVLAFTSAEAMKACLAQHAGSARKVPYYELAQNWPNLEWWLAVNPGLPIEGYLPSWFVGQLARGDARLPSRPGGPPDRANQMGSMVARARATAAVPLRTVPAQSPPGTSARPAVFAPAGPTAPSGAAAATSPAAAFAGFGSPPPAGSGSAGPPYAAPTGAAPPPAAAGTASASAATTSTDSTAGATPAGSASSAPAAAAPASAPPAVFPAPAPAASAVPAPAAAGLGSATASGFATKTAGTASGPSSAIKDAFGHRPAASRSSAFASRSAPAAAPSAVPAPGAAPPAESPVPAPSGAAESSGQASSAAPASSDQAPSGAAGSSGQASSAASASPDQAPSADAPAATDEAKPDGPSFTPANSVESSLLKAAEEGSTDSFLSTLLLAKVLLPLPAGAKDNIRPGDPTFLWRTDIVDDQMYVVLFTSRERMAEFFTDPVNAIEVKFVQLIKAWPGVSWSFAVNPGSPVGAKLPGAQIVALASWAADVGLGADSDEEPAPAPPPTRPVKDGQKHTVMQKTVPASHLDFYLERGYDRVCGFVHRASEVSHLRTPAELRAALGLNYPGSPFGADDDTIYVLRWPAYRPSLYRIPYGGQTESAMRAMEGWVIQRGPFRGNGFAPGESADVIAEFKVDSVRLPHGAQLWRVKKDATEELVAVFDADGPKWRRVGES
jgi:hypothetical protein